MYETPKVSDLGSVRDLTRQQFNKVGPQTDILNNPIIVGSLVELP